MDEMWPTQLSQRERKVGKESRSNPTACSPGRTPFSRVVAGAVAEAVVVCTSDPLTHGVVQLPVHVAAPGPPSGARGLLRSLRSDRPLGGSLPYKEDDWSLLFMCMSSCSARPVRLTAYNEEANEAQSGGVHVPPGHQV